jgi:heme exporter protein A
MLLFTFFAPLRHAGNWTWDEMLLLIAGLILIIIVAYFGQRSQGEIAAGARSLATNGSLPPPRRALAIREVSQRYGGRWALAKASLEVPAGQCLSILGPNGAGKTTLLHVLATLILPTAGDVVIGGASLKTNPADLRQHVGLVAHQPLLYPHLTVLENLSFFARLYHLPHWPGRAEDLLKRVRLWSQRHQPLHALSQGQKQRVAIARALLHDPDILLLDEPYAGLDLRAAERLDKLLDDLTGLGHTTLITTHDLQRGLERSDQLLILAEGRVVYQAHTHDITLETLQATYQQVLSHFTEEDDA